MSTDLHPETQITEKDVFERLDKLERTVYVPIVSGEVTQWLDAVTKAIKRVEETACGYFRAVHPELYEQIAEQDPEQNSRVQALERADDEICGGLQALVDFAEKLQAIGNCVESDERRLVNVTKELSDRAVGLVLRIRKHETEISTWHVEAMMRDRGPVD